MKVFDFDDFGCNHIISDLCQTRDCREELRMLKDITPAFKVTLLTVPEEMTMEMLAWSADNQDWVELAIHGFTHNSNWECEKMTYEEFADNMRGIYNQLIKAFFVKGFKAPGWQISDDIYKWLLEHDWWVADQPYNDGRRPKDLAVYKVGENSVHLHTWNCMGNGIQETLPQLKEIVKNEKEFKFVSEVVE